MKRTLAATATVALIAIVLWKGRGGSVVEPESGAVAPTACIEQMFVAARDGDVAAYLECFSGSERQRLERQLTDQSQGAFATALQQAVAELKGCALLPAPLAAGDTSTTITVDRVYAGRQEQQKYHLILQAGVWTIVDVEAAAAYQPEKPYGTPVYQTDDQDVTANRHLGRS